MAITVTRDKLRLELGDTNSTNYVFTDDELDYFLDTESDDVMRACLRACEAAARKFARAYDLEADGQRFRRQQIAPMYAQLAKDLRAAGVTITGVSSALTVTALTRIDSYSDDIPADQTSASGTAVSNPRTRYVQIGSPDLLP